MPSIKIFWHKEVAYLLAMLTFRRLHIYIYDYTNWSLRRHEYCYTLNLGYIEFNWDNGIV
jgi:hypothetical protein